MMTAAAYVSQIVEPTLKNFRQNRNDLRRAMLQWDVSKLATRSGIDVAVILRAESADGTPSITLAQAGIIQQAFEHAGVRFGQGDGVLMAIGKGKS